MDVTRVPFWSNGVKTIWDEHDKKKKEFEKKREDEAMTNKFERNRTKRTYLGDLDRQFLEQARLPPLVDEWVFAPSWNRGDARTSPITGRRPGNDVLGLLDGSIDDRSERYMEVDLEGRYHGRLVDAGLLKIPTPLDRIPPGSAKMQSLIWKLFTGNLQDFGRYEIVEAFQRAYGSLTDIIWYEGYARFIVGGYVNGAKFVREFNLGLVRMAREVYGAAKQKPKARKKVISCA